MELKNISVVELKALAYDTILKMEQLQVALTQINNEISSRVQVPAEEVNEGQEVERQEEKQEVAE